MIVGLCYWLLGLELQNVPTIIKLCITHYTLNTGILQTAVMQSAAIDKLYYYKS